MAFLQISNAVWLWGFLLTEESSKFRIVVEKFHSVIPEALAHPVHTALCFGNRS